MEEEKAKEKLTKKLNQLYEWPEDRIKTMLKEKLESDNWAIKEIHWGKEQGKDVVACRNGRTIVFEAKGEPKSPLSDYTQRRHYTRDALASIISYMIADEPNCKYCLAFPKRTLYISHVHRQIPSLVRRKLGLYVIFLDADGSIYALFPNQEDSYELDMFERFFE